MSKKKILILGVTGMLGHVLFERLSEKNEHYEVFGTARNVNHINRCFSKELVEKIRVNVNADNFDTIIRAFAAIKPDIVINCIGLVKQIWWGGDPLSAITVNAQLPHRISLVCSVANVRMIHISTDCVFNGKKGMYSEQDPPDAEDLYGKTKNLGEVSYPHCVTLRTSIIGHELKRYKGLIEWFLTQRDSVQGYTKAIFSGFPTNELARIISEFVLPNPDLKGILHVSSEPISKYELLKLVAKRYEKQIEIRPYDGFSIDRSLDSSLFRKISKYSPPSWPELVNKMYQNFSSNPYYKTRDH